VDLDRCVTFFRCEERIGEKMENYITCPKCKRIITNNPTIESAAKGEDHAMGTDFIICECGERISFWMVTAQLRDQKTFGWKFQKWLHGIFKGQAS
jgi:hypothetical protein